MEEKAFSQLESEKGGGKKKEGVGDVEEKGDFFQPDLGKEPEKTGEERERERSFWG